MDINAKHWMDKALTIVEEALAGERVQTSVQLRLVSKIAEELSAAWMQGLEADQHINCDDEECDECLGNFTGAKFKVGQKVHAFRKNWTQTARNLYGKEIYTITGRARNEADEIEYELTSDTYPPETTVITENDIEWEIILIEV